MVAHQAPTGSIGQAARVVSPAAGVPVSDVGEFLLRYVPCMNSPMSMEVPELDALVSGPGEGCLPPDCFASTRWLYDYWAAQRPAPDMLPGRQHLDPVDFYRLWPWIWMVDVQHRPLRFKFRLIGTELVALLQHDHTGRWLDEAVPELLGSPVVEELEQAVTTRTPGFCRSPSYFRYEEEVLFQPNVIAERLFLPLAGNGRLVNIVLVLTLQDDAR